ncbi:MAG: Bpu10I family restriction endonuclease [Nitrospirae bacterium]|nr:Bpu10I family restriction endonuclease [Nitrospirota bacterium]
MIQTPHKDKLLAALNNPKCNAKDRDIISEALKMYYFWVSEIDKISCTGKERIIQLTKLLNQYKDQLEVELIFRSGSQFLIRQKGQLKLDNSVIEEFLIHLINPQVLDGLPNYELCIGPQRAFMSLAFTPTSIHDLGEKPRVEIKEKDTDFTLGKSIYYKFSSEPAFATHNTKSGMVTLAVFAAECKINLDKTMFQEAAGTAARLKQGCPMSRYYLLVEFLDMEPEDCRLTSIDNVFLLRHAKRLPFGKRTKYEEVKRQHQYNPIDPEVIWKFVSELQYFVKSIWYDPDKAIERGSFV